MLGILPSNFNAPLSPLSAGRGGVGVRGLSVTRDGRVSVPPPILSPEPVEGSKDELKPERHRRNIVAKYRVGMIATGSIARSQATGWQGVPDVEMVALADTNEQARAVFGEAFGIAKRYADYREMLDEENLDIVSICSWHLQHAGDGDRGRGP